ncbi:hypothetical protein TcWFU_002253 [Taenia crassiceps]|uniref:Uncharacterized protein n=1 Tax=Taenia crassiceps TaxID=6207 RepID=A0ABR4Q3J4_9CEST
MSLLDIILSDTLPIEEIVDFVWSSTIDDYRQSLFEDSNHPLALIADCSNEKYTPQVVNKSASGMLCHQFQFYLTTLVLTRYYVFPLFRN